MNRFILDGSIEPTQTLAGFNVGSLLVLVVIHLWTSSRVISDESLGCVMYRGLEGLPEACMLATLFVLSLTRASAIHGMNDPSKYVRLVELGSIVVLNVLLAWWFGSESGAVSLQSRSVADSCLGLLDVRQSEAHSTSLVWLAIRHVMVSFVLIVVRDERHTLLWSLRDRIQSHIDGASSSLFDRAKSMDRVLRRVIPTKLRDAILQQKEHQSVVLHQPPEAAHRTVQSASSSAGNSAQSTINLAH